MIYATIEQLTTYLDSKPVPADADRLLRSASRVIASETKRAIYATDPDGVPTSGPVRDALAEATMEQVMFWADQGVKPWLGAGGMKALAASKSIGGASISYTRSAAAVEALAAAPVALSPNAYYALDAAGLIGGPVINL